MLRLDIRFSIPDWIRTSNLRLRRPTRYPIVPRGQKCHKTRRIMTGRDGKRQEALSPRVYDTAAFFRVATPRAPATFARPFGAAAGAECGPHYLFSPLARIIHEKRWREKWREQRATQEIRHDSFMSACPTSRKWSRNGHEPESHLDPRGNFDQPHPPRASVTFTLRVGFASAVEVSTAYTARTCVNGNGIWFERVAWIFFRGRIGDLLS